MPQTKDDQRPAQVPGDAESPPRSEPDRTAQQAVKHSDRTEHTQSEQGHSRKSG